MEISEIMSIVLTVGLAGLVLLALFVLGYLAFVIINKKFEYGGGAKVKEPKDIQPQIIKIESSKETEAVQKKEKEYSEPFAEDIPMFKNKKVEDIKIEKSFNGRLGKID